MIQALAQAQTKLGIQTKLYVLNPKAISISELYGVLDPTTRDWTDGLLSNIFREINRPSEKKEKKFIVFDGDVDAVWVENMNSVMDDNRLLTLPNGERIRLQAHCSLLFEVGNLDYASPATVSRAGMVFVDPKNLGVSPFYERWVLSLAIAFRSQFSVFYQKYMKELVGWFDEGLILGRLETVPKTIVPCSSLSMTMQMATLVESQLIAIDEKDVLKKPFSLESLFLQSLVWSFGAVLLQGDRDRFSDLLRTLISADDNSQAFAGSLPGKSASLFDHFFDLNTHSWSSWESLVPSYTHQRSVSFHDILVPTSDTVRHSWFLAAFNKMKKATLFVGETGSSKTVTLQNFLKSLPKEANTILNVNFSSRTSSMDIQKIIEANVEKRKKDVFGPPNGKHLVLMIDDLNMPSKDKYGTQQPVAFLKLLIEKMGLYDRGKELNWKNIKDVEFFAAMGTPGGGRQEVDQRFTSLFSICNVVFPKEKSLFRIFSSLLRAHLALFSQEMQGLADTISRMTIQVGIFWEWNGLWLK